VAVEVRMPCFALEALEANDVNNDFEIVCDNPSQYKVIHKKSGKSYQLDFSSGNRAGITSEILLAIMLNRLQRFQLGKHGCIENDEAIHYLEKALASLQQRTLRQANTVKTKCSLPVTKLAESFSSAETTDNQS